MQDMLNNINGYFEFINAPDAGSYIFLSFLTVYVVVVIIRIIVAMTYRVQQSMIYVNAKPLNNRAAIKETHSIMLNKIMKDYVRLGEKGVTLYSSRDIVEKHASKMNFIGLSCVALESFVNALEQSEIYIGIILVVVFENYRLPFAIGTLVVFLITRLFSIFFDFNLLKTRLIQETVEYIDREVGQFFVGDLSTLFTKFRNEVSNSLHSQTEGLTDAIKKMGDNIAGVMRLNSQEMSKSVDISMEKVSNSINDINASLASWKNIIEMSEAAQASINETIKNINAASLDFSGSSEKMTDIYEKFITGLNESNSSMQERITELKNNAQALQKFSEPIITVNASLKSQLEYIERNQALLEASMQKYELSLQEMTAKIGEALGSIVDYHIQNSYNSISERLEENIKQTVGNNNSLILRLQQLFEEMRQLSRSETQAIIKIKEQMDLHFDNLSEKMFVEQASSKQTDEQA